MYRCERGEANPYRGGTSGETKRVASIGVESANGSASPSATAGETSLPPSEVGPDGVLLQPSGAASSPPPPPAQPVVPPRIIPRGWWNDVLDSEDSKFDRTGNIKTLLLSI
jgi:hypothetical protein